MAHLKIVVDADHSETDRRPLDAAVAVFTKSLEVAGYRCSVECAFDTTAEPRSPTVEQPEAPEPPAAPQPPEAPQPPLVEAEPAPVESAEPVVVPPADVGAIEDEIPGLGDDLATDPA